MRPKARIVQTEPRILVEFSGSGVGPISCWPEAREDLGLNRCGNPSRGVEILDEEKAAPWDEYSSSYEHVLLSFDDTTALERAKDCLYDGATERSEWGDHRGAEKVQEFAGAIPHSQEVLDDG